MTYSCNPTYSKARAQAVRLVVEPRMPLTIAARRSGIHRTALWRWLYEQPDCRFAKIATKEKEPPHGEKHNEYYMRGRRQVDVSSWCWLSGRSARVLYWYEVRSMQQHGKGRRHAVKCLVIKNK